MSVWWQRCRLLVCATHPTPRSGRTHVSPIAVKIDTHHSGGERVYARAAAPKSGDLFARVFRARVHPAVLGDFRDATDDSARPTISIHSLPLLLGGTAAPRPIPTSPASSTLLPSSFGCGIVPGPLLRCALLFALRVAAAQTNGRRAVSTCRSAWRVRAKQSLASFGIAAFLLLSVENRGCISAGGRFLLGLGSSTPDSALEDLELGFESNRFGVRGGGWRGDDFEGGGSVAKRLQCKWKFLL